MTDDGEEGEGSMKDKSVSLEGERGYPQITQMGMMGRGLAE